MLAGPTIRSYPNPHQQASSSRLNTLAKRTDLAYHRQRLMRPTWMAAKQYWRIIVPAMAYRSRAVLKACLL